jgi:hypothetical protein
MSIRNDDEWTLGETWSERVTCTASDGSAITSIAVVDWALKTLDGTIVLQKTSPDSNVVIASNVVTVTVPTTDQGSVGSRTLWRRLKITDNNGAQSRQIHGFITVLPND